MLNISQDYSLSYCTWSLDISKGFYAYPLKWVLFFLLCPCPTKEVGGYVLFMATFEKNLASCKYFPSYPSYSVLPLQASISCFYLLSFSPFPIPCLLICTSSSPTFFQNLMPSISYLIFQLRFRLGTSNLICLNRTLASSPSHCFSLRFPHLRKCYHHLTNSLG